MSHALLLDELFGELRFPASLGLFGTMALVFFLLELKG